MNLGKAKGTKKYKTWTVAEKLEAVQARRQGLTLAEVRTMFGRVAESTISKWTQAYETGGIAALERAGGGRFAPSRSARVEAAETIIDQVIQAQPQAGIGKVQGALYRHGFLKIAKETVRKLLSRKGRASLIKRVKPTRNKPPKIKNFERALPNDLWQTDIMSFMLKGQYRTYLIGFMDDNSRFIVGWGLYRFQTQANVLEVFRAAIEKHGMPKEVLSDNGRQYYTWRGKSQFTQMLTKLGIRHIRSRPYHPQTLGKVESFWRNLFQECLSQLPLSTFEEAKDKIGDYIEYYNFKRPHQGIGNLIPSDRFFKVAGQVQQIIEQNTKRVEETKAPMADYAPPAYIVGNLGGQEIRIVAKEAQVTFGNQNNQVAEEKEIIKPELRIKEGEIKNGESVQNDSTRLATSQTSQPNGTLGTDSFGSGASASRQDPVPAGECFAGAVLPLDALDEAGSAPRASSEPPGSQADSARQPAVSDRQTANKAPVSGKPDDPLKEGMHPMEAYGSGGPADHPTPGLGAPAQDRG